MFYDFTSPTIYDQSHWTTIYEVEGSISYMILINMPLRALSKEALKGAILAHLEEEKWYLRHIDMDWVPTFLDHEVEHIYTFIQSLPVDREGIDPYNFGIMLSGKKTMNCMNESKAFHDDITGNLERLHKDLAAKRLEEMEFEPLLEEAYEDLP